MTNKFQIEVVAVDKFSATFQAANAQVAGVAPKAAKTDSALNGWLTRMTKGLRSGAKEASNLAGSLGDAASPLERLIGIGAAGSIVGAVAGIVAMTGKYAQMGFQVAQTSTALGVSTDELQKWTGSAKLANIPAETMVASLSALQKTLQDAFYKRDFTALNMLQQYHIPIERTADGAWDLKKAMMALADTVAHMSDPAARRSFADALHIPEDLLPYLLRGADGVRQLREEAARLSLVNQTGIQHSKDYADALNKLGLAAQGAGQRIADYLDGPLTRAMRRGASVLAPSTGDSSWLPSFDEAKRREDVKRGMWRSLFLGGDASTGPRRVSGAVAQEGDDGGGSFLDGITGDAIARADRTRLPGGFKWGTDKGSLGNALQWSYDHAGDDQDRQGALRAAQQQNIQIHVNVANAPAGTTVTARSSNGTPVRISTSTP